VPGNPYTNPSNNPYQSPTANVGGLQSSTAGDSVSPALIDLLTRTRPWTMFVAVLGLIGVGIMILGAIGTLAVSARFGIGGIGFIMALLYLGMAAIYALPCIRLVQFSSAISQLRISPSARYLEIALDRLRSFWKTVGIMILVGILLGVAMAIISAGAEFPEPGY